MAESQSSESPDVSGKPDGSAGPSAEDAACWLSLAPEDLLGRCRRERYQGSGPGGQKRNRVYSGVRLTHEESGLTAECAEFRESHRNLHVSLGRLRLRMALSAALPPPSRPEPAAEVGPAPAQERPQPPRPTLPVAAVLSGKPFRADANPAHADFPGFAFAALQTLSIHRGQVSSAAAALGCTASALTRFLKADKSVWAKARELRASFGLHPLK